MYGCVALDRKSAAKTPYKRRYCTDICTSSMYLQVDNRSIWDLSNLRSSMKAVGFQTKLCKPRHPFTKGKVERLVRFVKENFLVDRTFQNISDLNWAALNWCNMWMLIYTWATFQQNDSEYLSHLMAIRRAIVENIFVFSKSGDLQLFCKKSNLFFFYVNHVCGNRNDPVYYGTWHRRVRWCVRQYDGRLDRCADSMGVAEQKNELKK